MKSLVREKRKGRKKNKSVSLFSTWFASFAFFADCFFVTVLATLPNDTPQQAA